MGAELRATRVGIGEIALSRSSGDQVGRIDLRRPVRLAPGAAWPIEADDQAGLWLAGARYFAWWQRTTDALVRAERRVALSVGRGADRRIAIQADLTFEGWRARHAITHGSDRYLLEPRARMSFDFALSADGRAIAALKETSSFWTLSRKTYALTSPAPLDDLVASFALLLAIVHHAGG